METNISLSSEAVAGLPFPCDILLWRDTLTLGELQELSGAKRLELPRGFRGSGALRSGGVVIAYGVVEMGEGGLCFRIEEVAGAAGGIRDSERVGGGYQVIEGG